MCSERALRACADPGRKHSLRRSVIAQSWRFENARPHPTELMSQMLMLHQGCGLYLILHLSQFCIRTVLRWISLFGSSGIQKIAGLSDSLHR